MKIIELTDALLIQINNEEAELLERFEGEPVAKRELTERETVLANDLTVKGVLVRIKENGRLYYKRPNRG
jgi:hypothetical protein